MGPTISAGASAGCGCVPTGIGISPRVRAVLPKAMRRQRYAPVADADARSRAHRGAHDSGTFKLASLPLLLLAAVLSTKGAAAVRPSYTGSVTVRSMWGSSGALTNGTLPVPVLAPAALASAVELALPGPPSGTMEATGVPCPVLAVSPLAVADPAAAAADVGLDRGKAPLALADATGDPRRRNDAIIPESE